MRNSLTGSSTIEMRDRSESPSATLIGSLLLLAASFALLVLGPTMLTRFQGSAETMPASGYINIAAASGIALGGGAAMISVMARLVRDIELRPYAGLAPVLAVFSGFLLWGLRTRLPIEGVAAEYVGVSALALSVAGGALIGQPGAPSRIVGWLLAFFAPVALLLMLWSSSGQTQFGGAWSSFVQPVKMYLYLLSGSAFALAILGEAGRALRRQGRFGFAERTIILPDESELSPVEVQEPIALKLPRKRTATASAPPASDNAERLFPTPQYGTANMWRAANGVASGSNEPKASQQFEPLVKTYTPRVSVWDFEDEPLTLPKKNYVWKGLFLLIVLVGGGGAAWYYGMMLPEQQKERAALELMNQRKAQIQAVEEREALVKRQAEAKEAAERLEKYLQGATSPGPGAQATPSMEGAAAITPAPSN